MPYYTDECGVQRQYDDQSSGGAIQHVPQQHLQMQPAPGQIHRWEERSQSISIIPLPPNGRINLSQYQNSGMNYGQAPGQGGYQQTYPQPSPQPSAPVAQTPAPSFDQAMKGLHPLQTMLIGGAIIGLLFIGSNLRDQNNRLQGQQEGMEQVLPYVRQ